MARSVRRNGTTLSGDGSLKEKPTGGRKKKMVGRSCRRGRLDGAKECERGEGGKADSE
jgi:hypothetical protein